MNRTSSTRLDMLASCPFASRAFVELLRGNLNVARWRVSLVEDPWRVMEPKELWRRGSVILPSLALVIAGLLLRGVTRACFVAFPAASSGLQASQQTPSVRGGRRQALGLVFEGTPVLLADQAGQSKPREDGAKEEDLPPWADMVQVLQDVLSGKPGH
ncbi:hypothetical protein AK812_SmicGene32676 [Symbiodinium microadriaticum]|uniref:Uncharacterized protein n=1 Tax=Symbiodinium microadriaticum TaxID=2951 RepID=A0A1Q9CTJ7_SYMMI|nr:hypothetical protein AK812_SmicGene32676 [Symbiodinium microadriaticum]